MSKITPQLFVFLFIIFTSSFTFAQDSTCDCRKNFDLLVQKLEANYIAFHLTKDSIAKDYEANKKKYQVLANKTNISHCTKTLQGFLGFFKDGHLFVSEFPKFSQADVDATKAVVKSQLQDFKNIAPSTKTNIEGFWTDGESKFAIVKNKNSKIGYDYLAIILEAKDQSKIGEIKFAVSNSNGKWEGIYYTNGYALRYVSVIPYKDKSLLSIWGGITWGKLATADSAIYSPTLPTIKSLNEQTVLLTIPSFLIEKSVLDKVINENQNLLNEAGNLIIDVRGNTGGNGIYFSLLGYYYEKPLIQTRGWAVSSEDNLAYFSKFASNNANDPYQPVISEMKTASGKIVKGPNFPPFTTFPRKNKLKKVVILTDNGTMSAAETFVLFSKEISNKVVIMGENSGGVVDYNNINMVKLDCEKHGIMFGYPTYTLHDKIPNEGYNKTGIIPDVKIEKSVINKIGFVLKYLK